MKEPKFIKKLTKLFVKAENATERSAARKILHKAEKLFKKYNGR